MYVVPSNTILSVHFYRRLPGVQMIVDPFYVEKSSILLRGKSKAIWYLLIYWNHFWCEITINMKPAYMSQSNQRGTFSQPQMHNVYCISARWNAISCSCVQPTEEGSCDKKTTLFSCNNFLTMWCEWSSNGSKWYASSNDHTNCIHARLCKTKTMQSAIEGKHVL